MIPVRRSIRPLMGVALAVGLHGVAAAHGVAEGDKAFIQNNPGTNIIPYMYLGAKHMVREYDHLLFLFGVIFFLHRLKDVGTYVTLFAKRLPIRQNRFRGGSSSSTRSAPRASAR